MTMVGAAEAAGLRQICQSNDTTLYMTLLTALGVLLCRYSTQNDLAVGTSIANRQDSGLEELIGFFVNKLVLRLRIQAGLSLRQLLLQVRRTALDAYKYQDIPFERLVEELSPRRSLNMTPLYQVSFTVQNAPWVGQKMAGLTVEPLDFPETLVRTDLELYVFDQEARMELVWIY